MKNSIEEDIVKVNTYIELVLEKDYCNCNELNTILGNHCDGSKNVAYAMQRILSNYKRVLKENEELKNDYENLSNSVVVKNHCIKNSIPVQKIKDKIEELKEQYNVRELDFIKTTQDIRKIIIQSLEELIEGKK